MAEEIDRTIRSLDQLNKVVTYGALEFQGFKKSILEAANGADAASKRWNIFSRLVSGTPLWKVQNYVRGALGVLAEMENTSKANAEATKQQNEKINEQIKGFRNLTKEITTANQITKKRFSEEQKLLDLSEKYHKADKKFRKEHKKGARADRVKLDNLKKELLLLQDGRNDIADSLKAMKSKNSAIIDQIESHEKFNRIL